MLNESVIAFDNVSFAYAGAAPALHGVSFSVARGEVVALIGANGAGKTTASKMINGLLRPTGGSVSVLGADVAPRATSALARQVGYLFQNPDRQICQHTVDREVRFGMEVLGLARDEIAGRAAALCALFDLDPGASPFSLSGGERQRVALASILAVRPEILVLDEPTTGLDARETQRVMEHIMALNAGGTTVIMVTHDMDAVAAYASRAIVLAGGRLIGDGTADEVLHDPGVLARASLVPPQMHQLVARLAARFPAMATITGPAELAAAVVDAAAGGGADA